MRSLANVPICAAQAMDPHVRDVVIWLGVLIVIVVVGVAIVMAARRGLNAGGDGPGDDLDLNTLRTLRDSGQMSPEEYESARALIVARHGGSDTTPSVSPIDPTRLRARPGTDLTGDPLPRPARPGDRPADGASGRQGPKN